ncbi:MAG TPA: SemiSWEET family transporter [Lacibacter sp.]|nr:SemiSWEET family transporter [Lacibacter sp.]HMO87723.1 SemiSWEET family transporter [Lacibacter sp.]HMP86916.1 SemiSWEET family transporter [Lacibacter sp.]
MNWVEPVGLFGSFLSSITFVPQVYKAWQSRSVGDLSIYTILIVTLSTVVWLIYGFFHQPLLLPVVLCNGFIFLLSLVLLYFKLYFGKGKS